MKIAGNRVNVDRPGTEESAAIIMITPAIHITPQVPATIQIEDEIIGDVPVGIAAVPRRTDLRKGCNPETPVRMRNSRGSNNLSRANRPESYVDTVLGRE